MHNILLEVEKSEARYNKRPHSVSLIAASKGQSAEKIRAINKEGQIAFGENYLQEALIKMIELADCKIEWHFIGPVQSNKTRKIAEHFSWVQSVDSEKIAKRLNDQRPSSMPPLNICVEVNIDQEPTKSGVLPQHLFSLINYCGMLPKVLLRGLMAIPSAKVTFEKQCESFRALHELWRECKVHLGSRASSFDTLSMGMSADFDAAIKEGATMVRIGTALFGERGK